MSMSLLHSVLFRGSVKRKVSAVCGVRRAYARGEKEFDAELVRRRIKWRSMERGMKENEIILRAFVARHLEALPEQLLPEFERLLDTPDPDLYRYITGVEQVPDEMAQSEVWKMLVEEVKRGGLSKVEKKGPK